MQEARSEVGVSASATIERAPREVGSHSKLKGRVLFEFFDKDGNLYATRTADNGVCNTALNDVLNEYFRGTSQTTTWYMGLIDNASFTALAAADTIASHAGWIENTNYSSGTRPTWSPGAASSQAIVNGTQVSFTMSASSLTIRGVFIVSDSTKGGTSGLLYSTAAFNEGNQAVNSADVVKVTYTVSMAAA